jgi:5-aminopentanamidase
MAPQFSRNGPAAIVRVAVAQTAPELGAKERNLGQVVARLEEAAAQHARLVVFPECALSGYLLDDLDDLEQLAEPVPGPAIERLAEVCADLRVYTVVGLLEKGTDAIYNSAVLVGPDGMIALYRKTHLPGLGLDRLVAHGNIPFAVHQTPVGRIGMAICYDIRFPEPTRLLALHGADIVVIPSNWPAVERVAPPSAIPDILTRARAIENRVFLAVADRAGEERGSRFLGRSQLVDVFGTVVAEAGSDEALLYADFDLALARQKDFVYTPGRFETHWFADRRTDLYGPLVEPELWPQTPRRAREVDLTISR